MVVCPGPMGAASTTNIRRAWRRNIRSFGLFSDEDFGFWTGERDEEFVLGFGANRSGLIEPHPRWDDDHWSVYSVPHAYVAMLFAVLPSTWLLRRRANLSRRQFAVIVAATYGLLLTLGIISIAFAPGGVMVAPVFVFVNGVVISVMLWVGRLLLNRRTLRLAGRCLTCGYDLRATPDRCPECGVVPGVR
jgi:hypothetical protein